MNDPERAGYGCVQPPREPIQGCLMSIWYTVSIIFCGLLVLVIKDVIEYLEGR